MAGCFLLLACIWLYYGTANPEWLPVAFLSLYAVFFLFTGVSQLYANTLQGKLIRPNRQGRLMSLSTSLGSVLAITFAALLLGRWLAIPRRDGEPGGGFAYIFAFSGVSFVIAALLGLLVREPADAHGQGRLRFVEHFRAAARILRTDRNFRSLVLVAMLFSTNMIVMPHYQALARVRLDLALGSLVTWVVVQNAATGVYGVLAGTLADRRGNLAALRYLLFGTAAMPLVAIGLAALGPSVGGPLYWIVFALFGMMPITLRVLTNLTLELAPHAEHARYLSTVSLAMAMPFVLSPLVGWLVDLTSFEAVFVAAALVIGTAALLTSRVAEPRAFRKLDASTLPWAQ
jgi:MFS family permease